MTVDLEELRNDIVSTQATIDQARAHLRQNKHLFTEEQAQTFAAELDDRQNRLDIAKRFIDDIKEK